MPGYRAANCFATRSAAGRSSEVYQTTLPSFCAALISSGVIAAGGGACASTLADGANVPAATAADPFSTSRLEIFGSFMDASWVRPRTTGCSAS